jgi:hypothetical protein
VASTKATKATTPATMAVADHNISTQIMIMPLASIGVMKLLMVGTIWPNASAHRPPPTTGAGGESGVRETWHIRTQDVGRRFGAATGSAPAAPT